MSKTQQSVTPTQWRNRTELLLINAHGYLDNEVTASNLITTDLEGNVVYAPAPDNEHGNGLNAAGFVIHTAIHQARPDLQCVIHSHCGNHD